MKADLVNLGVGQAGAIAILGYLVVFLGLVLLQRSLLRKRHLLLRSPRLLQHRVQPAS